MTGPAHILVTGATGAVGSTVMRALQATGRHVHGVGRRSGMANHSAWYAGRQDPPPELRRSWDAIVHCAADTRWNLPDDEAMQANVAPLRAILSLADSATQFIHLSSSFATGLHGDVVVSAREAYRNSYEWSKAAAERCVRAERDGADIVRFPLIIGSRTDGALDRYSGFFWVLAALCSGAVPALVAREDGLLDMVSTDDVAQHVVSLLDSGTSQGHRLSVLGRGADAQSVKQAFDTILDALNSWRTDNDVAPLERPPYITPQQWNRFYLPFIEEWLDRVQLTRVAAFRGYQDYLSIAEPFDVTTQVPDTRATLRRSVLRWAETHADAARRTPKPWSARQGRGNSGGRR
ncbi:SDR family oxidoreductase [Streptomyces sp. NPDC057433]|uniref:SDR family oxidoreductase n=1 Tax=Streptomyces sp. NPDC057433 TaxID=3346132 RepID=UPI00367AB3E4